MMNKDTEEESRKLFRFIDYNNDGLITKQHIKMFMKYVGEEFKSD